MSGPNKGLSRFRRDALKYLWSAAGAAAAMALVLRFITHSPSPFLLASLGGSTIFLFALTETEAAQPRALFGGHLIGAGVGVACFQLFGSDLWVYVLAVVLSMIAMILTRTIHPPAGANPLIMVQNHAGCDALLNPVAAGALTLFAVAFLWSRLRPGNPYPTRWL